jgi:hypothetical protein
MTLLGNLPSPGHDVKHFHRRWKYPFPGVRVLISFLSLSRLLLFTLRDVSLFGSGLLVAFMRFSSFTFTWADLCCSETGSLG